MRAVRPQVAAVLDLDKLARLMTGRSYRHSWQLLCRAVHSGAERPRLSLRASAGRSAHRKRIAALCAVGGVVGNAAVKRGDRSRSMCAVNHATA